MTLDIYTQISYIRHQKQKQQTYMNKLEFIKVKNFCASNDTIKKVKRYPRKTGENICKKYIYDNICLIYPEHLQLTNKKKNYPMFKSAKEFE